MARVTVTNYELERDLLPPVCVRCGAPAADRVVQVLHIIDGRWSPFHLFGILFGLLFFPPLVRVVLRYAQSASARLPMCPPHRDEFVDRERWSERVLLPVWTATALVADGLVVIDFLTGKPGSLCFAPLVVLMAGVIGLVCVSRWRTGIDRRDHTGLLLTGVSEEFATALAADRARDRVSKPDRRAGHGDVRDDYDDEVV